MEEKYKNNIQKEQNLEYRSVHKFTGFLNIINSIEILEIVNWFN